MNFIVTLKSLKNLFSRKFVIFLNLWSDYSIIPNFFKLENFLQKKLEKTIYTEIKTFWYFQTILVFLIVLVDKNWKYI